MPRTRRMSTWMRGKSTDANMEMAQILKLSDILKPAS